MSDLIRREDAIEVADAVWTVTGDKNVAKVWDQIKNLPSAQPETLTDKELKFFLLAMNREEKVCKKFDEEDGDCILPYEDSLVRICHEIRRKVISALWT